MSRMSDPHTQSPAGGARRHVFSLLIGATLAAVVVLTWQLVDSLRQQQHYSQQLAALDDVRYGLLDPNAWVEHVTLILERKINAFEVTPQNRAALRQNLSRMLDTLITEVDRYMRAQNLDGNNWWERTRGKLKQSFQDIFIDIDDIKTAIPEYADRILKEMDSPDARREINTMLKRLLGDLSASTFSPVDYGPIEDLKAEHDCEGWQFCRGMIRAKEAHQAEFARNRALAVFGLSLLLFALIRLESRRPTASRFVMLTIAATCLMAGGVLTPMIEVEARITEMKLLLLGEPIVFADQVLYFQSKSVLDMVRILVDTGAIDMIFVGGLIMLFSVIFPLAKLGASLIYLYAREAWRQHWLIQFFALKSGKWSMADVMVVAIFMAYIGFSGIIASQLTGVAQASPAVDMLTTNGTELQIGFFMFLAFCLCSMMTATWMERPAEDRPTAGQLSPSSP